jgi:hypothetical protein
MESIPIYQPPQREGSKIQGEKRDKEDFRDKTVILRNWIILESGLVEGSKYVLAQVEYQSKTFAVTFPNVIAKQLETQKPPLKVKISTIKNQMTKRTYWTIAKPDE